MKGNQRYLTEQAIRSVSGSHRRLLRWYVRNSWRPRRQLSRLHLHRLHTRSTKHLPASPLFQQTHAAQSFSSSASLRQWHLRLLNVSGLLRCPIEVIEKILTNKGMTIPDLVATFPTNAFQPVSRLLADLSVIGWDFERVNIFGGGIWKTASADLEFILNPRRSGQGRGSG